MTASLLFSYFCEKNPKILNSQAFSSKGLCYQGLFHLLPDPVIQLTPLDECLFTQVYMLSIFSSKGHVLKKTMGWFRLLSGSSRWYISFGKCVPTWEHARNFIPVAERITVKHDLPWTGFPCNYLHREVKGPRAGLV